ncbi:MAG: DUF3300 domain-containing protein [Desulfuromonadaceae bacterium]|nr:DUF3300 domain-containing protein [Desulfuromonadaceae bacterium]
MRNRQKAILTSAVSLVILVILALAVPLPAMAQNDEIVEETQQTFNQEQLAQLLAPIALYPDELIAQVLLASTYPLEIVMADRWVRQNKDLQGNELATALEKETWDPSVKALVNFPTVLDMLSQKLDLTTKLGDAFLEQKEDVMDTIQELRKKAADAGYLKSTREQKVLVEDDNILIEPADTSVIYVPTYDPYVVYGPWWYPAYPPYYFYSPPYPGVVFSFGIGVTLGLPWGYAWGGWDWYDGDILINMNRNLGYNRYINRSRYTRYYERRGQPIRDGQILWQHDPGHRRGVAYKDKATAQRFGQLPARSGVTNRESRGFITPSRTVQGTRSGGAVLDQGKRATVPSGSVDQRIRTEKNSGSRFTTTPKAPRESAFTGGYSNGTRVKTFSERGRQSIGGSSTYRGVVPSRSFQSPGFGVPRGGGADRGGVSVPAIKGRRGDR